MKIAMSCPIYLPDVSGQTIYTSQLSRGLLKRGHEVEIFTLHSKRTEWFKKYHRGGYKDFEIRDGITVRRFDPKNVRQKYRYSLPMLKALLGTDADIVHSHHFGYFPSTAGFIAAKMRRLPHVFGPYYHPPIYGGGTRMLFWAYHLTQGLPLLRHSDSVLPHTEHERKLLAKIGAPEDRMELLPNIVDTKLFRPGRAKDNIVLFASHMISTKGPHIAMQIAERILSERKDVKFVFLGIGKMEDELRRRAAKIDRKRIIFMKNVSTREMVETYSRAKVMILPSYYEAFAKVLAESMACETPVVSTRVGGIPEVVGDTGFLADYGDWKAFQSRIEELLDDDALRKRLGRRARRRMQEKFDIDVVVDKLERIYKRIT